MGENRYKYFIVFNYTTNNQGTGFGNGFYSLENEITDMKTIKKVTAHIKNELKEIQGYDANVVITNFQRA